MASITCGNCRRTHASVIEVRSCYAVDAPAPAVRNVAAQVPAGFYRVGGAIWKVTPARRSERTFAHELMPGHDEPVWAYRGIARRFIPEDAARLTLAEAAEYGRSHGHCLICGRLLTAAESVAAGIGPVCSGKLAS